MRRAVIVHFLDDLEKLYEKSLQSNLDREIQGNLVSIVSQNANVEERIARKLVAGMETHLLDEGQVLPGLLDRVNREMPAYRLQAIADWLAGWLRGDALPGGLAGRENVGVWLVADASELKARYHEIAGFLRTGEFKEDSWRNDLMDYVRSLKF
jgi:hypothetical protein